MPDAYDTLAPDYDWLFSDESMAGGVAIAQPATARVLSRLEPDSQVLDAACGTGVDTAVLARRGFRVWAADRSAEMLKRATQRFQREGLAVPVVRTEWSLLPQATDERFDAVVCLGNALVHAEGDDAMVAALTGLRGVVRPGGFVVVDTRNWEKLHTTRPFVEVADKAIVRDGMRCIVAYVWHVPQDFEADHVAHLVFVFDDGEAVRWREHRVAFRPFTLAQLRARIQAAGLCEIDTDFDPAEDRYSIVAQVRQT